MTWYEERRWYGPDKDQLFWVRIEANGFACASSTYGLKTTTSTLYVTSPEKLYLVDDSTRAWRTPFRGSGEKCAFGDFESETIDWRREKESRKQSS